MAMAGGIDGSEEGQERENHSQSLIFFFVLWAIFLEVKIYFQVIVRDMMVIPRTCECLCGYP
jgi:hypothetical protein